MKNKFSLMGIFSIFLIFGFLFICCDNGNTTNYNNDAGSFEGTWTGIVMGYTGTVTISYSGWTVSVPGLSYFDNGFFNRNGNSAILYSGNTGKNLGTAIAIDSTTIRLVLNGNSVAPGTYTLTSYNNDAGSFEGTWTGTVMGYTGTVTISYSGWTVSVPSLSYFDNGSFNRNGNSAILYSGKTGKNLGTAIAIDSTTIQLVLNGDSDAPGTYTLTRKS